MNAKLVPPVNRESTGTDALGSKLLSWFPLYFATLEAPLKYHHLGLSHRQTTVKLRGTTQMSFSTSLQERQQNTIKEENGVSKVSGELFISFKKTKQEPVSPSKKHNNRKSNLRKEHHCSLILTSPLLFLLIGNPFESVVLNLLDLLQSAKGNLPHSAQSKERESPPVSLLL